MNVYSFQKSNWDFSNLVKTFGAGPKPKQTRKGCLTTWILHILMSVCWEELQSKRLWDLFCTRSRFLREEISDNANLPFWSALKRWMHWVFFRFITRRFPPSFFPIRKMLLRNSSGVVSIFWIGPFSSNSDISWSTSRECYYDIFIVFGGFSWTPRFVNGIWYPFLIDKISWWRVIFSHCFTNCDSLPTSGKFDISSVNNFLATGERNLF